jgi:hypothetical protein
MGRARRVAARLRLLACGASVLACACAPGRDYRSERAVLRATLVELFATRERARAITVWHDPREQAPTLSAYGGPWDHHDTLALQVVDTTGLALPFRVERTTLAASERFFREHPKGWDAWFEANPGNAGIVEVVKPRIFTDSAVMVVGRACGEICRTAWRVSLTRAGGAWQVRRVTVLTLPR